MIKCMVEGCPNEAAYSPLPFSFCRDHEHKRFAVASDMDELQTAMAAGYSVPTVEVEAGDYLVRMIAANEPMAPTACICPRCGRAH